MVQYQRCHCVLQKHILILHALGLIGVFANYKSLIFLELGQKAVLNKEGAYTTAWTVRR